MEKSAQPVSALLDPAEGLLHAVSGRTSVVEDEEDKVGEVTGLLGLEGGAEDVPVSMGISSKLAVHTGPENSNKIKV